MLLSRHNFGEDISYLKIKRYVWKRYHPIFQGVANRITINFNIFGAFMENRIGGNLNNTCVISMKWGRSGLRKPKLFKKTAQPYNFRTSSRYSTILGFGRGFRNMILFLHFQEIKVTNS
jgi:hypothetical protein